MRMFIIDLLFVMLGMYLTYDLYHHGEVIMTIIVGILTGFDIVCFFLEYYIDNE